MEVRCTVCGEVVEGNGIGHSDSHPSIRIGRLDVRFTGLAPNFVGIGEDEDPDAYDRARDRGLTDA